jgi:hypothetical protein
MQGEQQTKKPTKKTRGQHLPYVLNITPTPHARNQSALAAKLGN